MPIGIGMPYQRHTSLRSSNSLIATYFSFSDDSENLINYIVLLLFTVLLVITILVLIGSLPPNAMVLVLLLEIFYCYIFQFVYRFLYKVSEQRQAIICICMCLFFKLFNKSLYLNTTLGFPIIRDEQFYSDYHDLC
jgi:hypothetical protein